MTPGDAHLPDSLSARVDGGMGAPSHEVEWTGGSLVYRRADELAGVHEEIDLTPDAADWRRFWAALDRHGVWEWAAEHDSFSVNDGPSWAIGIAHADRGITSSGSNSYPPDPAHPDDSSATLGIGSEPRPSRSFRGFCSAVRRLAGGREFR